MKWLIAAAMKGHWRCRPSQEARLERREGLIRCGWFGVKNMLVVKNVAKKTPPGEKETPLGEKETKVAKN